MINRAVIVGASLAGGTAAAALRDKGFDGEIVLIGAEPEPPYERPPLSKQFLRGQVTEDSILVKPAAFWSEAGVTTRFGVQAIAVDPERRRVTLSTGDEEPYDALLITTGGVARRLNVPGADLDGVGVLRSLADARDLRARIVPGGSAVVVGMGFIGAEVAASLKQSGMDVTAVEPFSAPLERALGAEVGAAITGIHRDHGVNLIFGDSVEAFEGASSLERVRTANGQTIECSLAVVGVGIIPATGFLESSGIALDNGVLVDERCRASADGVWAAGDVANHAHPLFGRARVEHWQNAIEQGTAAAGSMLGEDEPYKTVHWFWSDQFDDNIQYAGHHRRWDRLVFRGSLEERSFLAFYIEDGAVRAVAGVNRGRDVRRAMKLIAAGGVASDEALTDESVDLRTLGKN